VINGILFGGVVVLWAAFLVPWALRRYDEAMSERPIETFSDAVRVLRRSGKGDEKPVSPRRTLKAGEPSGAYAAPVLRPSRAAAKAAAARRRRVLLALLLVVAVVGGLAAFSMVPVWAVAIPAGLVLAWLVLCRVQVRGEDAAAWAHRRAADSEAQRDPADDEVTARITTTGAVARPPAQDAKPVEKAAVPVSEADLVESASDVVPVDTSDGSSLWDPLPVTLPTYVSKPRANRSIRTIDLDAPNTWTSGHVEGEQTEMPAEKATTEHRRAVGD
jgi:hypothetical protein